MLYEFGTLSDLLNRYSPKFAHKIINEQNYFCSYEYLQCAPPRCEQTLIVVSKAYIGINGLSIPRGIQEFQ